MPRRNYTRGRNRPKRVKFEAPTFDSLLAELQRMHQWRLNGGRR